MITFNHKRSRNAILATALTVGALGLSLASSSALAMGAPESYDVRGDATPVERSGNDTVRTVKPEDYIGGRVQLPRPGAERVERPASEATSSVSIGEYIGEPVGLMPLGTSN